MSTISSPITPHRLAELLAKARASRAAAAENIPIVEKIANIIAESIAPDAHQGIGIHGEVITYNAEQLAFIQAATSGESSILIGAAGTGKTTCTRGAIQSLIQSGKAGFLASQGHKYLRDGTPGIVAISYTRRAVSNLRKAMPEDMLSNCLTIHKLLQYQPVYYTVLDEATGEEKVTMRFEATRNAANPLPSSIRTIIIDESSMVSVELFKEILNACPHKPQFIFLGDIQQLPPVFGSAILGYKMLELTTIELTQVYRQALESPIIRLAHRILSGKVIESSEFPDWNFPDKLKLHPWKKKLSSDIALLTAAKFFTTAIDHGSFDIEEDIILLPFNKAFGTIELNKHIAQHIAHKQQQPVWEIICGFNKIYLHIGLKVLYDKEDAVIIDIARNGTYAGKSAQHESPHLDYWGHNSQRSNTSSDSTMSEEAIDFLLDQAAAMTGDEDRVKVASHLVTIRMLHSDEEIVLESASELNSLLLGYSLTIHKSQGSEWRKVFLVLHQSHATMIQRELLYTAVTRAREELYCICEAETFINGIKSQRIKGNTLAEKSEYFKGKKEDNNGTY